MSLEQAYMIPGWMTPNELQFLAQNSKARKNIVEIGSFMGRSTMALSETSGKVWAVDTFTGSEEHREFLAGRNKNFLFNAFKLNLFEPITAGKVIPVRKSSIAAAKYFSAKKMKFDMIFIDASHDYKSVKNDISTWRPLLAEGGLFCGHDYENGTSEGLERAVREMLPSFRVMPGGSIWYAAPPIQKQVGSLRKTVFTLNIDGYAPEITSLTYPLLRAYAYKIGAEFKIINERKFPDWPVVYEKLQIYELGKDNDFNIYIDSDALIHPDMFDPTNHLHKDTVFHNGNDMAGNRWRYDRFFRRDGRHLGSCNWFTGASDWCIDLWKPLDDLSLSEALENIFPIVHEQNSECFGKDHLIDDYTLSRNISKFGLKFKSIQDIQKDLNDKGNYIWHAYTLPRAEKVRQMKDVLRGWGLAVNR